MKTYYAVRAQNVLGYNRAFFDSYPTVKLACDAAKQYKREHPAHVVHVLKETPRLLGHQFGACWTVFRLIR